MLSCIELDDPSDPDTSTASQQLSADATNGTNAAMERLQISNITNNDKSTNEGLSSPVSDGAKDSAVSAAESKTAMKGPRKGLHPGGHPAMPPSADILAAFNKMQDNKKKRHSTVDQ